VAARVEILAVGSLHRDLEPAARHFLDLLRPHATVSLREVKEVAQRGRSEAEVLREEGRRLLAAWPRAPLVAALAVDGRALDTQAFAAWLQRAFERGGAGFVIGGSLGLCRISWRGCCCWSSSSAPARSCAASRIITEGGRPRVPPAHRAASPGSLE
jgi:23S rRNA pseudoU1915 N3-methylase RlmH